MDWYKRRGPRQPHPYEGVRQRVRRFLEPALGARHVAGLSAGLFPFNGAWLTETDILAKRQRLVRADRILVADLMIVASAVLALSVVLILLVAFVI